MVHLKVKLNREMSSGDYDSESFDADAVNWEIMKYLRCSRDSYQNWGVIE